LSGNGQSSRREAPSASDRPRAGFYCVANARYFLGAVGLVNSLRLLGHREPIFLLDCGLTPAQQELLAPQVRLVPSPSDEPPFLVKTIAPLSNPSRTMVLVDTDMIVTRSMTTLIEQASEDRVVAFEDRQDRFFPEWGELLELGTARRGPYVSSGLVFLGGAVGERVLRLMDDRRGRVDFELTFWRRNVREYPFLYADQDVLNAVLATQQDTTRLLVLEQRLAATPPYRGLHLVDEPTLRCAYRDGTQPYVVHQYVRKPWLEQTYHSVYSRLLARLLLGEDVPVRVPEPDVPLPMRDGLRARAQRARINATDFLRWHFGDRLPQPIGGRVEALRRRREPWRA
jgi:hypothetical protein